MQPKYRRWQKPQLFSVSEPLALVTMNIVRTFSNNPQGNQAILALTEHCCNLTWDIPNSKMAATHTAITVFDHCSSHTVFRRTSSLNLDLIFSANNLLEYAPLLVQKRWREQHTIHRRTAKPRYSIYSYSCAFDTTLPSIQRAKMHLCKHWRMRTALKPTVLQTKRSFSLVFSRLSPRPIILQSNGTISSYAHVGTSLRDPSTRLETLITFCKQKKKPMRESRSSVENKTIVGN